MQHFPASPRRTHRKRTSALRLSSDTTATLPEYIATGGWVRSDPETPSDLPPEYPDSAEEADEDTDDDIHSGKRPPYVPQLTGIHSPRNARPKRHRRKPSSPSSSDLYLDSLLERSVHALEMSNALLQSSMSTQNTLSNVFSAGSPPDSTLEVSARGLSSRIRSDRDMHEVWADDLAEISRDVERLFGDHSPTSEEPMRTRKDSISSSVPSSTSPINQHRRRPSLDLRNSAPERPQLRYDQQDRGALIAHPPRALTQYIVVDANGDPDSGIVLPSTIGLRSAASHHAAPSFPIVVDKIPEPSTKAYNMLSSLVTRSNSSASTTSSSRRGSRRGSSNASVERPSSSVSSQRQSKQNSPERSMTRSTSSRSSSKSRRPKAINTSPYTGPSGSSSSSSLTITMNNNASTSNLSGSPHHPHSPYYTHLPHSSHPRPMTPPQEESSSSSDTCHAKQTISALRKILDEQPPPVVPAKKSRPPPSLMKLKIAHPIEAGTSTATASISRLFTKPTHTSSTRPPSPPRISSMKGKGKGGLHSRGGSLSLPASLNGSEVPSPAEPSALSTPGAGSSMLEPLASPPVPAFMPASGPASAPPTESRFTFTGLPTPSSINVNKSFSDMFGAVSSALVNSSGSGAGSRTPKSPAPSSGVSTPKRISFVDPVDGTIRVGGKGKSKGKAFLDGLLGNGDDGDISSGSGLKHSTRRKKKDSSSSSDGKNGRGSLSRRGRHRRGGSGSGDSRDESNNWWMGWLMGASGGYSGPAGGNGSIMKPGTETRGWGGSHGRTSGYSSGLDDWTV